MVPILKAFTIKGKREMNRRSGIVAAISLFAVTITPVTLAEGGGSRPEGVSADEWVSLGPDAGFVVIGDATPASSNGGVPSLSGFLLARYKGKWVRLESDGGIRIQPAR